MREKERGGGKEWRKSRRKRGMRVKRKVAGRRKEDE